MWGWEKILFFNKMSSTISCLLGVNLTRANDLGGSYINYHIFGYLDSNILHIKSEGLKVCEFFLFF